MRRDDLPVGKGQQAAVFPADLPRVRLKPLVEAGRPAADLAVVPDGLRQHPVERLAVLFPIGVRRAAEILQGVDVVVRHADDAGEWRADRRLPAAVAAERRIAVAHRILPAVQAGHAVVQLLRAMLAGFRLVAQKAPLLRGIPDHRGVAGRRKVQPAPVDAPVVAAFREHALPAPAAADGVLRAGKADALVGRVHGRLGADVQVHAKIVRFSVLRLHLVADVGNRAGHQFPVVHQQRREKLHAERHAAVFKAVAGARGENFHAFLLQGRRLGEIVLEALLDLPQKAEPGPVHTQQPGHRVLLPRPVAGNVVVQPVRKGPDIEVGVHRHEREGRRSKLFHCSFPPIYF